VAILLNLVIIYMCAQAYLHVPLYACFVCLYMQHFIIKQTT